MNMIGCTQCKSTEYTLFTATSDSFPVCLPSRYIQYQRESLGLTDSALVRNCALYRLAQVNGLFLCAVCAAGFAPSSDGRRCQPVPNCAVASINDPNACVTCLSGYILIKGSCIRPSIANCASFVEGLAEERCLECLQGFALSLDRKICLPGKVSNCQDYRQGDPTHCLTCAKKFALANLRSFSFCFPVPDTLNCESFNEAEGHGLSNGILSCSRCAVTASNAYGFREQELVNYQLDQTASTCLPLPKITGCLQYKANEATFGQNSFQCTKCDKGNYLIAESGLCKASTQVANCATYSESSDACTACNTGFFLSPAGQCLPFPTGIFMCTVYSKPGVCSECGSPFFLKDNACIRSPVIENCARYKDFNVCSLCQTGFVLSKPQVCERAVAKNCYTYHSPTSCSSCDPSDPTLGLQTTNGVTSCAKIQLPNCL